MSDETALIVVSTVDTPQAARELADRVVGAGLAACVNILPGVTSVFRWEPEGQSDSADAADAQVQAEGEVMLLMKTAAARYPALEEHLRAAHPYELPEIVAVPVTQGLPGFVQWIEDSTAR